MVDGDQFSHDANPYMNNMYPGQDMSIHTTHD